MKPLSAKRLARLQTGAIIALALVIYLPTLGAGRLGGDDTARLQAVAYVPLFSLWTGTTNSDYWPLTTSVEWLMFQLFGTATVPIHVLSLGLHLLSSFLLWRLLSRLGVRRGWIGGLLFAIHPVAVPSVAWLSEVKNTLSLPLLLGTVLAWLRFDQRQEPQAYIQSLALFAASMLAKTSGVAFPFVILLHTWWARSRITRQDMARTVPFFCVALVLGALTLITQQGQVAQSTGIPALTVPGRLATAGLALAHSARTAVWPYPASQTYPRFDLDPLGWWHYLPWISFAVAAILLWRQRRTWGRHILFGLGAFVLSLLPVLGFVDISYFDKAPVGDHLAYVALASACGLLAAAFSGLWDRTAPALRRYAAGALCVLTLALAVQSHRYAWAWASKVRLSEHTLAQYETSFGHSQLAWDLLNLGHTERAVSHSRQAVRLAPEDADGWHQHAVRLFQAGHTREAVPAFEAAIRLAPEPDMYHRNLRQARERLGLNP